MRKALVNPMRFFPTQITKGRLDCSFQCPKEYRQRFNQSVAQLTISVGQPVHEGERLISTLELINRTFASCKIMLDDSIQSYTLAIKQPQKSKEILLQEAIVAGDNYLDRHLKDFKDYLTIPYEIIRWRNWISTPLWEQAIQEMNAAYVENAVFRAALNMNVSTFLGRYEKQIQGFNKEYDQAQAYALCRDYLIEECAVMKTFWPTLGCQFEVYPSGRNQAMTATYQLWVASQYPDLLQPVALRFNRRKNLSDTSTIRRGKNESQITQESGDGSELPSP